MNLRYKLFLGVGILFLLAFVGSFFLETNITQSKLYRAKKNLREDIFQLNEQKRQHIEKFLAITIAENQAEVTALLQNTAEYKQLLANYTPTQSSVLGGTWLSAASTLVANKWIDFLQNTDEGHLSSMVIPDVKAMVSAHHVHIDKNVIWVTLEHSEPLIGVRFYIDLSKEFTPLLSILPGTNPSLFILFSPESICSFLEEWKGDHPSFMENFFTYLNDAALYVQKIPTDPEERTKWITEAIAKIPPPEVPYESVRCIPDMDKNLMEELNQLLTKNDELYMTWRIVSLLARGPFSEGAPKGIARFPYGYTIGEGFLTKDIFFPEPLFNDVGYYLDNKPTGGCWHPANSIAVINPPGRNQVFLGNTLQTKYEDRTGYLTIARNADHNLLELALSLHETSFLVHDGKVISAFTEDGQKILTPPELPVGEMLERKNGFLEWKGQTYFYLHMIPMPSLDLHFFIIDLESKEFAFVNQLDEGAKRLIASLSFDMRVAALVSLVVVLIMLHGLSKRITKPITQLARAAQTVGEGHLEEVTLPAPSGGKHDEVTILCEAFAEMVQGLKEKEKVKAVLDKVVSEDIAHEILKGHVHLGGEEKNVTVLFGDIRGFTEMTSKMAAAEVVELLNTCMTKISTVVDDNGGVIDKYVGDEVMALFGAPIERPDSALKAVESAVQMMAVLDAWNVERRARGLHIVALGIGIHTGVMLAGNMGAENRLNYTVLGRNVNLASRLCSSALGGEILISRPTYEAPGVKEKIDVEPMPPARFKGFDETFEVFRVKGLK